MKLWISLRSTVPLAKDGVVNNFVVFRPKKSFVKMYIYTQEFPEITDRLEQAGIDINYSKRTMCYDIKISDKKELTENHDDFMILVDGARAVRGVD